MITTIERPLTIHRKLLFTEQSMPPFPVGYKLFFIANPGTGKTLFLNWIDYLAALSGNIVLILDGESPPEQVERNLNRYGLYAGTSWKDLQIVTLLQDELVWGDLNQEQIDSINPDVVSAESITSFSDDLNNPKIGKLIKTVSNKIHNGRRWLFWTVHTNQDSYFFTIGELQKMAVPNLGKIVNGNTSIVSQGCDIGYIFKQISQNPLRIAVFVKGRRYYSGDKVYYYELYEPEGCGDETPMWWREMSPVKQGLSEHAIKILGLIKNFRNSEDKNLINGNQIMSIASTIEANERRDIIQLLLERGDIVEKEPFVYGVKPWKGMVYDDDFPNGFMVE